MGRVTRHRGPRRRRPARRRAAARSACAACRSSTSQAGTSRCRTRMARCGWSRTARSTTTGAFRASCARRATFRDRFGLRDAAAPLRADGDVSCKALNGMFAFALWDSRRRRLVLGRDRLGIKPLYVWNDGRRLIFASEAKAILRCRAFRRSSTCRRCRRSLALGYVPAPQSMFRGIAKLPPATLLVAENGRVKRAAVLAAARSRRNGRRLKRPGSSACATASMKRCGMQMVSDVPIGAFLSGGVDSSAVVAMMSSHSDATGQDLCDRLRRRTSRSVLQRAALREASGGSARPPAPTAAWSPGRARPTS